MAVVQSIWSGISIPPAEVLNGVGSSAADRNLVVAAARSVVRVTYGTDRVAAQLLNILPSADGKKLVVQLLWGYAVDGIDEVLLNDKALPATTTVTHYLGTQTTPNADLVAAMAAQTPSIAYTQTLQGYAYSVLLMPIGAFDGQLNVSARVRGRRLYDPRKDSTAGGAGAHRLADSSTWEYSDCPALALADWSASAIYGAGRPVVWSSVSATANANDAAVGAEKRRTIALTIGAAVEVRALGETLRAYAGCWVVPTAQGLKFIPDQDQAPVDEITHAAGRIMRLDPLILRDNSSTPTAVEVIYTDTTQTPWRDGSAIATLPGAGTTRPWRLSQVRMPGITRYSQAMREAIERLNKLTMCPLSTTLEVMNVGVAYERADIITVSHPAGLQLQKMRVLDVSMATLGTWQLQVQQHDPAAYSDAVQTTPAVPGAGLDSPQGPPDNVDTFTVTVTAGNLRRFTFGYTGARPPLLAGVQIRYRAGSGAIAFSDWDDLTPLGGADDVYPASFETSLPPAGTFTFAARAMRMSGQRADSLRTATATLPAPLPDAEAKDPTPPPAPSGVEIAAAFSSVMIKHAVPTYTQGHGHGKTRIYGKTWTAGALPEFGAAALIGEFTGPIGSFPTMLGTTWRVWLTWVSADGFESTAPAGGTNGFAATTGRVGGADLAPLAVTAAALADDAVNLGSSKVTGTITDPARFGALAVGYTVTQYLLANSGVMENLLVTSAQITSLAADKILAGSLAVGRFLQSTNFVANSAGWQIRADGSAEFSNIHIRGTSTFDGLVTMRNPDGSIAFTAGGTWPSSSITPAAGWLNSNIGGVNLLYGPQLSGQAGPGEYGRNLATLRDAGSGFNPFSLKPGESLTISAEVWQDLASDAAGQYATLFLWCQRSNGDWTSTASLNDAATPGGAGRRSATVVLPAVDDMHLVVVGLFHQGGSSNTVGTVFADRIQVERGISATQYKPGVEPGATKGATWNGNLSGQPSDGSIFNNQIGINASGDFYNAATGQVGIPVSNNQITIGADGTLRNAGTAQGQVALSGLGYAGDLDATRGAPAGTSVAGDDAANVVRPGNPINSLNIGVYMGSAAIRLAFIDTASIARLSALSAFLGGVTIDSNGYLRGGQTDWAVGAGFFLGWSSGAYRFSIGNDTAYLRWSPTGGLEFKQDVFNLNFNHANNSFVSGTGLKNLGRVTATPMGGVPPYTFQWSMSSYTLTNPAQYTAFPVDVGIAGQQDLYVSSAAGGAIGRTQNLSFTVTCTDANGRVTSSTGFITVYWNGGDV